MWAITYMANSIEQVLFLPRDMTKLRNLKKLNIPVSQEGLSTGKLSNPSSLSPSFSTRYIVHLMINLELTFSLSFLLARLFRRLTLPRNGRITLWLKIKKRSQVDLRPLMLRLRLRKRPRRH